MDDTQDMGLLPENYSQDTGIGSGAAHQRRKKLNSTQNKGNMRNNDSLSENNFTNHDDLHSTLMEKFDDNDNSTPAKQAASIKFHQQLDFIKYLRPYQLSEDVPGRSFILYRKAKRITDVVCSISAIITLFPLLLFIAITIVADDPKGGPIFKQKRVGKNCKEFNFYKFRSMYVDAEDQLKDLLHLNEVDGHAFKIKDDPRITRIGKFIRNTCLDELPQLFNVLKGDMSLVGPRPPIPREVEKYDDYQLQRLKITPGLTCFWQVLYHRHDLFFDEWVALDIKYAAERSYWLDWILIFKTMGVLFRGHID